MSYMCVCRWLSLRHRQPGSDETATLEATSSVLTELGVSHTPADSALVKEVSVPSIRSFRCSIALLSLRQ